MKENIMAMNFDTHENCYPQNKSIHSITSNCQVFFTHWSTKSVCETQMPKMTTNELAFQDRLQFHNFIIEMEWDFSTLCNFDVSEMK